MRRRKTISVHCGCGFHASGDPDAVATFWNAHECPNDTTFMPLQPVNPALLPDDRIRYRRTFVDDGYMGKEPDDAA